MKKHLVLAGCGHANLTLLVNIDRFIAKGHRVTVVSPSPYHYYSGMGPGLLGGTYRDDEIRFHIRKAAEGRGAAFKLDKVLRVEPDAHKLILESGESLDYDAVAFNVGSYVPLDAFAGIGGNVYAVKPIENLGRARDQIRELAKQDSTRCVIVGGGAAAVEMAGNVWRAVHEAGGRAEIRLLAGSRLLSRFPARARRLALASFVSRGMGVEENTYVTSHENGRFISRGGREYPYDLALIATGIRPSTVFQNSPVPTDEEGALLVNRYLQCEQHPELFGGGDCIGFRPHPLDKVGVYAVRENPILLNNLMAFLEGRPLQAFSPQKHYHLIFNLGDGKAISCKRGFTWDGRLSFRLKDTIDRKFMRRFQVSGEV